MIEAMTDETVAEAVTQVATSTGPLGTAIAVLYMWMRGQFRELRLLGRSRDRRLSRLEGVEQDDAA